MMYIFIILCCFVLTYIVYSNVVIYKHNIKIDTLNSQIRLLNKSNNELKNQNLRLYNLYQILLRKYKNIQKRK